MVLGIGKNQNIKKSEHFTSHISNFPGLAPSAALCSPADQFFGLFGCGLLVVFGVGEHQTSDIEHQTSDIEHQNIKKSKNSSGFALFVREIDVGVRYW
ncbi:MAG: hypothetical protein EAY75_13410 [Bacteroidetes bacterium]|nr:MAG: hypothetical protein EAY75_13410 [Bacteroidota bacterium]